LNKTKTLLLFLIFSLSLNSALALTLYTLTKQSSWKIGEYNYIVTTYYTTENGGHTWKVDTLKIESWNVIGFTFPNQSSTMQITLKNYGVVYRISNYEIRILETAFVIASGQVQVNPSKSWVSPLYSFNSPLSFQNYTIQISSSFVH
jgi:hypothetical protein